MRRRSTSTEMRERVAGIDVMHGMLRRGNQNGYRVYCLGASEEARFLGGVAPQTAMWPPSDRCHRRHRSHGDQGRDRHQPERPSRRRLHGVAHRLPESHASFGSRAALANVSALGVWSDPADDPAAMGWARGPTAALEPFSLRGGGYLNYASEASADGLETEFGAERFERLRAVKRQYDPSNLFRFNHNIAPD